MSDFFYGTCEYCGGELYPIWFTEEEVDNHNIKTGKKRLSVSPLVCSDCLREICIDDSFDKDLV